jgi:hypothetical protein
MEVIVSVFGFTFDSHSVIVTVLSVDFNKISFKKKYILFRLFICLIVYQVLDLNGESQQHFKNLQLII